MENIIVKRGPGRPRTANNLTEAQYAEKNRKMKAFKADRKEKLIARLGGQCTVTGSKVDLDFHHVLPSTKAFTIAHGRGLSSAWVRLVAEADKCVLVCTPVHKLIHAEVNRIMKVIRKHTELTPEGEAALLDYHTRRETRRVQLFGRILRQQGFTRYGIITMIRGYYEA